jgi:hypothetical protein
MASYCSRVIRARWRAKTSLRTLLAGSRRLVRDRRLPHQTVLPNDVFPNGGAPKDGGRKSLRTMMPPCLPSAHGGAAFFRRGGRKFPAAWVRRPAATRRGALRP